jgi:hypothetical protein
MIYEAKYDPIYSAYGTFRPLGTSGEAWKNMAHLPTVFAEAEPGQVGLVDVFDNADLAGDPLCLISAARVWSQE